MHNCNECNSEAKLIEQIIKMKEENPNVGRGIIAGKLGCSAHFVRTILKQHNDGTLTDKSVAEQADATERDLKIRKLKKDFRVTKKKYDESLLIIEELNRNIAQNQHLEELKKVIVPAKFQVLPKNSSEAVAITVASDWHIDEVVDGAAINFKNEFNGDIADKRVKKFFEFTLRLLNMCRTESKINILVVAALGDFMSGWIHDELMSTNSMCPPESIPLLFKLWSGGLQFLLDEGNLKQLIVVCCTGNHSRITKRIHAKQNPRKSYEWILYEWLASHFSNTKYADRIKFQLPCGYMNYLNIVGKEVRFHHGDGINYHGGVGGVHIPLRKAIAQWNKGNPVDLDVLGHWHCRETSRNYVMNGSLIGYNEYAEKIKADFEPPTQSFFILHPKYGKTAEFPIVLP